MVLNKKVKDQICVLEKPHSDENHAGQQSAHGEM